MTTYLNLIKSPDFDREDKVLRFAQKSLAVRRAKERGWHAKDVMLARSRFDAFWVICQTVGDHLRLLTTESTLEIPHPGRV